MDTAIATEPKPAAPVRPAHEQESLQETIESIVVALILAFVFRAFIVEAFVIPTGSMAPTLYGAHGTILCDDCGYEFAYGLNDLTESRGAPVKVTIGTKAACPNCNHRNGNLPITDDRRNAEKGDRILVLKWPLDLGVGALEPDRWQVTVFKDPANGETNFIKRLVGLPNEVLMIADGDVYRVAQADLSERTRRELENIRKEKYQLRTGKARGRLRAPSRPVMAELEEKMRIARKMPSAQESLLFVVYDHDYPPKSPGIDQPRWSAAKSDSGWDTSKRTITFEDRGGADDYIELAGKDIRAFCAYNVTNRPPEPVADLKARFVFAPHAGDPQLHIRMEKRDRVFWATIQADGTVRLTESADVPSAATPVMAEARVDPFDPGSARRVAFGNIDYRLVVEVDGEVVLESSDDSDDPAYYAPDLSDLRRARSRRTEPPRIYASDGVFDISHLVVERDVHYYHDGYNRALRFRWAPAEGWASLDHPIMLRGHEYFMLGDNTAASKDSRLWDEIGAHLAVRGEAFQLGTVPRDQIIGQAFFVYWPSGHRLSWLPVLKNWGLVPDVGRMRWIR